jgi:hypothetical protein
VAFRQALNNKDRINWEAYRGLKEFDRLGLAALLDLTELVDLGYFFCGRLCTEMCPPVPGNHGFSIRPSRSGLIVTW